jgi:hypothetical protein
MFKEIEDTIGYVHLPFYCEFCSSKFAVRVAGWRFSYVISLTDYGKMSAVCVQAWTLHVNMAAASHNLLNQKEKYYF